MEKQRHKFLGMLETNPVKCGGELDDGSGVCSGWSQDHLPAVPPKIAKKHEALHKAAQNAQNRLSLARGRRRDTGQRIQSMAEQKASATANSKASELRSFEKEHGLRHWEISY